MLSFAKTPQKAYFSESGKKIGFSKIACEPFCEA